jgi:dihydrofolate synthase / folylpolyglutamate synthase
MNYSEAWQFLHDLQFFKIKLGLDSMKCFLDELARPQELFPCLHIAGTNGKGSVATALCSICSAAGYKTGLYTSPHLHSVRERFRIGSHAISQEDFTRLIEKIARILNGRQITYFECTTILALLWFAEQEVDLAILEVGMGGRLDATNVVTPLVSVITTVSMDHEQYLGTTLTAIATEKAGIIKKGVPVVSGVQEAEASQVIEHTCVQQEAPLVLYGRDMQGQKEGESGKFWQYQGLHGLSLKQLPQSLRGEYQLHNLSLTLATVQLLQQQGWTLSEAAIRKGLEQTRWPARLEYFSHQGQNFLLDGAHNPAGATGLRKALEQEFEYRRLILLWGAMADKDLQGTLTLLAPLADHIIFTQAESERSASPEQLEAVLPAALRERVVQQAALAEALNTAKNLAGPEDLICVSGSLYLVGAVRVLLLGSLIPDERY